jgi:glycosyltransferase involved in cell wall biosynthesis
VADGPEAFAAAVLRLLRDAPLRQRLGEAARAFAEARYGPDVCAAALEREHQAAAARRAVTTRSGA